MNVPCGRPGSQEEGPQSAGLPLWTLSRVNTRRQGEPSEAGVKGQGDSPRLPGPGPGPSSRQGRGRATAHEDEGFRCVWPSCLQHRPLGGTHPLGCRALSRAVPTHRHAGTGAGPRAWEACHLPCFCSDLTSLREAVLTPVGGAEDMRRGSGPRSDRSWLSPSPLRLCCVQREQRNPPGTEGQVPAGRPPPL